MAEVTTLYAASHDLALLEPAAVAAKVARHSVCDVCGDCTGLRPADGVQVIIDDSHEGFALRLDQAPIEHPDYYLATCACGHGVREHGNGDDVASHELTRRAKVAIRIDELLQDKERLLDFTYTDSDIISLRKQMKLREESLGTDLGLFSPAPSSRKRSSSLSSLNEAPPAKKQRVGSPDSSDLSDDDDEKPLAHSVNAQRSNGAHSNGRSGKKTAPGMTLGGPAASSKQPRDKQHHSKPHVNGVNGSPVKVKTEDGKLDNSQLARIATGVTVDTGGQASANANGGPRQEKAAVVEERSGIIKVTPVQNDGQERSRVLLTGLKTLFQKQLPKMPREYITRLVFDENSRALAIVKRGLKVVGGITFRPFPHRGFAEIVFFATASVDQVRGYGGMLMNHFKMHIRKTYPGMDHFLTYADNYAVGYFRKQGFSKEITLDRSIWAGYIKDYEGGTLMQCTMVRKVDYLCAKDMLQAQREAILSKIREHSRSHIVYEGLTCFANVPPENRKPLDPKDVPGLRETGWTADLMELAQSARPPGKNQEEVQMKKLLSALQQHKMAWPFAQPVNRDEVPDYYDVIKHPMDLSLVEHKLEHHRYTSLDSFVSDCNLIFSNCLTYNPETTIYAKSALQLRKFLEQQLQALQQETS